MLEPYQAAISGVGLHDRSDRIRLLVTGRDRVKFLHNLNTNDIRPLGPGEGCEAFVTSPQGKTLALVTLLVDQDRILVRSEPGSLELLEPHFSKYSVFDEVELTDSGPTSFELHLLGPRVEDLARSLGLESPEGDLHHATPRLFDRTIWVIRESPSGLPGLTLIGQREDADAIVEIVRKAGEPLGLVDLDRPTFEAFRIEAGTPATCQDVRPENLPQELDRDARAINFSKGCYLGQETVARLDALGHVNKILRGLRIEGDAVPPAGTALLSAEGVHAGTITSASFSAGQGCPVALAMIRTAQAKPGTQLGLDLEGHRVAATVTALPMLSGR